MTRLRQRHDKQLCASHSYARRACINCAADHRSALLGGAVGLRHSSYSQLRFSGTAMRLSNA